MNPATGERAVETLRMRFSARAASITARYYRDKAWPCSFGRYHGRSLGTSGRGCTNAQAPVRKGESAAEKHHHGTEPDQQHQRLVIKADGGGAVRVDVAERHVELAHAARHQGGLGRRSVARREGALRRLHDADDLAVPAHRKGGRKLRIVRPGAVDDAVEGHVVIADRNL